MLSFGPASLSAPWAVLSRDQAPSIDSCPGEERPSGSMNGMWNNLRTRLRALSNTVAVDDRLAWLYPALAIIILFVVLIRTAWVTDDAYITFRTVDNLVEGFGPVWNVGDRVQTYTNPLWMFVVTLFYLLTGEIYYTVIFLSIVVTTATAVLLAYRSARGPLLGALSVVALLFSKAFVDFSTSGLENCLTHLLLVAFFIQYFGHAGPASAPSPFRTTLLFGTGALLLLNRLDLLVLIGPSLLYVVLASGNRKRTILLAAAGLAPVFLWEVFSLFYYGFPFPNTAYAKLGSGISSASRAFQGLFYVFNLANWDPFTLATVVFALVHSVAIRHERPALFAAAGIALYLAFVVKVGGDHMSGRFFTAPFVVSVVLLTRVGIPKPRHLIPIAAAMLLLLYMAPAPTLTSGSDFVVENHHDSAGIADLRGYVYRITGLLKRGRDKGFEKTGYAQKGIAARKKRVVKKSMIGFFGYYAGPEVHIVDPLGLGDPLLARLPTSRERWRVGHYVRDIPKGYIRSIKEGGNRIEDPALAEYWDRLSLVIRGPLLSGDRLTEILRFNTGGNDFLIDEYLERE
jgi:arabinofuranosyltransferase